MRYHEAVQSMRLRTGARTADSPDELWLLEHPRVFTLGQAALRGHAREPGAIPVVRSDRGGQVTYHGPGQLVAYLLFDLRRANVGVRRIVEALEQAVIDILKAASFEAARVDGAPGVYVEGRKIAAVGLARQQRMHIPRDLDQRRSRSRALCSNRSLRVRCACGNQTRGSPGALERREDRPAIRRKPRPGARPRSRLGRHTARYRRARRAAPHGAGRLEPCRSSRTAPRADRAACRAKSPKVIFCVKVRGCDGYEVPREVRARTGAERDVPVRGGRLAGGNHGTGPRVVPLGPLMVGIAGLELDEGREGRVAPSHDRGRRPVFAQLPQPANSCGPCATRFTA